MSQPVTDDEKRQFALTEASAGPTENTVSTACPKCAVRFAMLAHYGRHDPADPKCLVWLLRCTLCAWTGLGDLEWR